MTERTPDPTCPEGHAVHPGASFCPTCGVPLTHPADATAETAETAETAILPGGAARGRRRIWNLGFLALAVVLAGAAMGTAFLRANQPGAAHPTPAGSGNAVPSGGASASPTPGGSATSGPSRSVGIVDYGPATDPRAADVARALDEYFTGINTHNYQRVSALLDPRNPLNNPDSWNSFIQGVSTTTDSDIVLSNVSDGGSEGSVAAYVTFRSTQSPGYGPADDTQETCTRWSLTFTLTEATAHQYKIVNSRGSDSRC